MCQLLFIPFHPKIYRVRVDYHVNAQSPHMSVGTHACKYWEGWNIRNYTFEKVFS